MDLNLKCRKSSRINVTLAVNGLTPLLIARLDHQDAIARLNLLKLIKVGCGVSVVWWCYINLFSHGYIVIYITQLSLHGWDFNKEASVVSRFLLSLFFCGECPSIVCFSEHAVLLAATSIILLNNMHNFSDYLSGWTVGAPGLLMTHGRERFCFCNV